MKNYTYKTLKRKIKHVFGLLVDILLLQRSM